MSHSKPVSFTRAVLDQAYRDTDGFVYRDSKESYSLRATVEALEKAEAQILKNANYMQRADENVASCLKRAEGAEATVARLREALDDLLASDEGAYDAPPQRRAREAARAALSGTSDEWLRAFARKCVAKAIVMYVTGAKTEMEIVEELFR